MNSLPMHSEFRFVSRLTKDTLALILAGGRGTRLQHLTTWRVKPAVPFGGKFRLIDFPLSNCMNSGIRRIGVLTQYKSHSLIRHIQRGWGYLQGQYGEFIELLPAQQRIANTWYTGTADAVYQNIDIIRTHNPAYVLILAGDHIYKMDYGPLLGHHVETGADMTIACLEVPLDQAKAFGVMSTDREGRVIGFSEKPERPRPMPDRSDVALASMGIYVFDTDFLCEQLIRDADRPGSSHDFGHDLIPPLIDGYKVYAYRFGDATIGSRGYWRDVGTLDAYWQSNMELVAVTPELNLYDDDWPIRTYQEQLPPAKFIFDDDGRRGYAVDSMVSGGCVISGARIRRSLLFSHVTVHSYSELTESVLLPNVEIGRNCRIHKAIIDKGCKVPPGTTIGMDPEEDKRRFYVTAGGVVMVAPEMLGQDLHHVR